MSEQNSSSRFELPCSQVDEINGNVSHFEATADSFDETNSSTQNWNTNSSLPPESLTPTIQRDGNNASTHRSERSSAAYLEVTKTVTSVDAIRVGLFIDSFFTASYVFIFSLYLFHCRNESYKSSTKLLNLPFKKGFPRTICLPILL